MLVLRALDSNIGRHHLRSLNLRLRDVRFWGRSTFEAILCQSQRFAIGFHGILQQSLLSVGAPNLEIVDRNFGMEARTSRLPVGRACLSLLPGGCYAAANAPPQVDLI